MPPFDTPLRDPSVLRLVEKGLDAVGLRPAGEIQRMREIAQSWHWRSRTRELQESGGKPPAESGFADFDSVVRLSIKRYEADGTIPRAVEEDFPAKGKAYRDLTGMEFCEVRSVAMERHHALNWLCGYGRDNRWDETPTST